LHRGDVAISSHFSVILMEPSTEGQPKNLGDARAVQRLLRFAHNDTKIREFDIKTCETAFLSWGSWIKVSHPALDTSGHRH
jgi:hypothetical protein